MPFVEFIAGWISGAVGLTIGHPMDTVKVRLQTQSTYKGIFDCVVRTYRHEGFHGFFKGMAFPVFSVAVSNSVIFGSYSNALNYLTQSQHREHDQGNKAPLWAVLTAGCFSGGIQVLVMAPVDLVKVRLQNQTASRSVAGGAKYRSPMHCMAVIFREDGARGLFRGVFALALRDIPCYGLYFLPYEFTCRMLTEKGKQSSTYAILMAGGIAGTMSWACATPMDVVKARLQMSGTGGREYSGTLHCITASLQEEGIRVFFKGLLLNSVRAFPVNAVTFLSYETLIRSMTCFAQD
ncbi:solute carrier family 25 member 45 isoform X1 [Pygocentrus nattereri]|uniref:Solute carrier family 25 member 45 n=3 Tax=Pygocentrus nattereri TaxID=42514 RepID=A0A3B4EDV9_PYGNA|nr:solute carrier family 25 member 45 isoform X1 [Pygocentrus nattereri]XP_037389353.1 solute carrier family 25 member 45 isoform X1 [Pygocentrus nattereri]